MNTAKEFERILWIHKQLKASGCNKADYFFKFGNKERTFLRDIEKLRTYFNAPIEFDRTSNMYCYTNNTFELPVMLLNERELFGLLVSVGMLEQYRNTPLQSIFEKVTDKLASSLDVNIKYFYPKINSINKTSRNFDWDIMFEICKAIVEQKTISVKYSSFSSMTTADRKIDPYSVYILNNEFYLVGFCHKNSQFRDFALSRISEINILESSFPKRAFDITKYANNQQWGVLKGGDLCRVRFRVTRAQQQWVHERYKNLLTIVSKDENWVTYEVNIEVTRDFVNWVISLGEEIVIESPDFLVQQIVAHCKKIIQKYNDI